MSTTRVTVTVDNVDLVWLRRRAKRLHGGSLSAVMAEATHLVRKQEALTAYLDGEGVPMLNPVELAEIEAEWRGRPCAGRRSRKTRAA
jgi:hypothetical protein